MNTIEIADRVLPHLVELGRQGGTITYGELARRAQLPHHRPIARALGCIRDQWCLPNRVPMINAIVVNQNTQLPGESFLPGGDAISPEVREAQFRRICTQIVAYQHWDQFLHNLGLEPAEPGPEDLDREALATAKLRGGRESRAHKRLKGFVAAHPQHLGLDRRLHSTIEYPFPSGDRCDVVFSPDSEQPAVVEVKTQVTRGELVKGIYQAVKYRALLEALRIDGGHGTVRAFVVAQRVPEEVSLHARRLSVTTVEIPMNELG